jgi:hypothetical protein
MWAGRIYLVILRLMLKVNRPKAVKEVFENLWNIYQGRACCKISVVSKGPLPYKHPWPVAVPAFFLAD